MFSIQKIFLIFLLTFVFILSLSTTFLVNAQTGATTGTLVGIVKDRTTAVIAGAKVTARQVETNFTQEVVSQENGSYVFVQLQPGKYLVSAQAEGFQPFTDSLILTLGTT
ncbi:MAG: ferrienterochelin and colicins outer membrane receptor, partial [bacterium]